LGVLPKAANSAAVYILHEAANFCNRNKRKFDGHEEAQTRVNSKHETRNSKQIPSTDEAMTEPRTERRNTLKSRKKGIMRRMGIMGGEAQTRVNSKHETRNSKQIPSTDEAMTETQI
jgi:hypothetical protein